MRMDRGGAIAWVRCRSESAAGITKPISGFVKRLSAAGNETFFASCVAQEAKRGSFSGPALRRKQKGGLFRGPALCRKQKRVSFGALRYAGSKKRVFFGPCVVQEAKRGCLSGPCVAQEAKRGLFRALRNAGSKKSPKRGDHRSGRPFAYPPVGERNDE